MLNTIKTLIQEKTKFLEAADVIFEDVSNLNLDDQIILGLESANDVPMDGGSEEVSPVEEDVDENIKDQEEDSKDNEDENKDDDEDDHDVEDKDDDIINSNIEDESDEVDNPISTDNEDLLDSDVDDVPAPTAGEGELSLPGDDLSNTPVSQDNADDNLLNVEIDLGSNTVKDVLPVPPANAGDVIPGNDDTTSQHVDSGFSNENPIGQEAEESSSVEEEPVIEESSDDEEEIKESFWNNYFSSSSNNKLYSEAITIGDDDPGEAPTEAPAEEKPAEGSAEPEAAPAENTSVPEETPAAEESPVTAAVKDKVSEMDTEAPVQKDSKEDLLKKLGSITKSLEDAKKAVMNSIQ